MCLLRSFASYLIRRAISVSVPASSTPIWNKFETSTKMADESEYVEAVVCRKDDLSENEMKEFDLKGVGKVLLVKQNGVLSALGNKCTHYGAPLVNGALGNGRIRCQWHGACFNTTTGDIEDFPGLDSLPCYQVIIENDCVKVRAKRSDLESNKRVREMSKRDPSEKKSIVIVGGGPSGACCAETLRQEGYRGRLVLINKENSLPYDRVKFSKILDLEVKKAQLRSLEFYNENDIEVLVNTEVTAVDTENNTVTLSDGKTMGYDSLYIATGSKPRKINIPGVELPEVCVLRDFTHANRIAEMLAPEREVVVLGLGFIGMETAAFCAGKVKKVTVVGRDVAPFRALFGEAIGKRVMQVFEEKGVGFELKNGIKQCIGENGRLTGVLLNDGKVLKADVCIVGIGSTFATEFLNGSKVAMNDDGSISVNEFMQTNVKNVYAGGDIAKAPIYVSNHEAGTIGHYSLAHYHGRVAGLNMCGKPTPLKAVPFFWTQLFGKSIRYAGYGRYDDVKIVGDLPEYKFIAYYLKEDRVIAMAACQRDPVVSKFAELLAQGKWLYRKDIEAESFTWDS